MANKGKFAPPRAYTFAAWFLTVEAWVPESYYRAEVIPAFFGQVYQLFAYSKLLALVSISKISRSFEPEDFYLLAFCPSNSPSSVNLIVVSFRIWKNRLQKEGDLYNLIFVVDREKYLTGENLGVTIFFPTKATSSELLFTTASIWGQLQLFFQLYRVQITRLI